MSKKYLFIFIIIFSACLFYIFNDWPVIKDCKKQLNLFTPMGTWTSEELDNKSNINFIDDSFFAFKTFGQPILKGVWKYDQNGVISLFFNDSNYDAESSLQQIINNQDQEKYANIDVSLKKIGLKILYDQYNCNLSNPLFYLDGKYYKKRGF